ncbi:MAG: Omp28 family outer membrane lipoprotein [Bacteroidota bacterium]|jgi:thiol-disulfide isomerase/thioredoxin
MKFLHQISCLLLFVILFHACDKIKDNRLEKQPEQPTNPGDTSEVFVTYPDTGFQTQKKVLVEDYTGHTCGNCPEAAIQLDEIIQQKGASVVPVAIHVGLFAEPKPSEGYPNDFRTSEGTAIDAFFGISAFGLPQGMVDRAGFANQNHILPYSQWLSKVNQRLALPPSVFMAVKNEVNSAGTKLRVTIKSNFSAALSGSYKLSVYLAEDSIIASQKDYSQNPERITNYKHKHMLRACLNGAWGETISDNPAAGSEGTKKVYTQTLPAQWNKNKLYVIGIIYKSDTYEVIQAEAKKIR